MPFCKLEGRITVGATANVDVTEIGGGGGPFTVTITAGDYYPATLCSTIGTLLTNNPSLSGTYTCSLSDDTDASTGKVTISATGITSFTLTWATSTSQAIRDALGFTGNLSPTAASHTSANACPYLWLPNVGRTNAMGPEPISSSLRLGVPMMDYRLTRAPTGASKRLVSNTTYVESLEFHYVSGAKAAKRLESVTNESWETFYTTVLGGGKQIRYYPDRSSDTTYGTVVVENGADAAAQPMNPQWTNQAVAHYRVGPLRVFEYVA